MVKSDNCLLKLSRILNFIIKKLSLLQAKEKYKLEDEYKKAKLSMIFQII
jgi:hypothetical protein